MMNAEDEDMVMMDDEPIIHGLILKLKPAELRLIRKFLGEHNITVIYRATSYAPLYISRTKQD